jgi:hypothetical protein
MVERRNALQEREDGGVPRLSASCRSSSPVVDEQEVKQ